MDLPPLFPGFPDANCWLPLLEAHHEMLIAAESRVRVTAVEAQDAVQRHYAEALEVARIAVERTPAPSVLVDVGSGGGFPGIPMAAVLPGCAVHLVEPLQKRASLLTEMARSLGLTNVTAHAMRAEDAGRGPLREGAHIVTARAVAALPELLEYVAPFARAGGSIVLPKGSRLDEELPGASTALEALACRVVDIIPMRPEISPRTRVLVLEKVGETPPAYPRRAGIPGKRPLRNR